MSAGVSRGSSLALGFESLAQGRLILLLAMTTLTLALPAALALWPALDSIFAGTLAGDHVLRGHPGFASADVLEFLHEKADAVSGAWQAAEGAAILGVIVQILYAGGFVETLARGRRVRLGEFFAGAFRNFWHNLKCFAIFVLVAGVALGLWLASTGAAAKKLFEETPPGATSTFVYRMVTIVVALLLFAVLSLLHDFARIARRHDPQVGAWRAYGKARRMLSGAWLSALGLLAFWFVAGGGLWLLLISLEWGTAAFSVAAIVLHTLMQLAAVFVRSAVRLGAWGSFIALADGRSEALDARMRVNVSAPQSPISEPAQPPDLIADAPPA